MDMDIGVHPHSQHLPLTLPPPMGIIQRQGLQLGATHTIRPHTLREQRVCDTDTVSGFAFNPFSNGPNAQRSASTNCIVVFRPKIFNYSNKSTNQMTIRPRHRCQNRYWRRSPTGVDLASGFRGTHIFYGSAKFRRIQILKRHKTEHMVIILSEAVLSHTTRALTTDP